MDKAKSKVVMKNLFLVMVIGILLIVPVVLSGYIGNPFSVPDDGKWSVENFIRGSVFTMSGTGTINGSNSCSAYLEVTTAAKNMKMAVYNASDITLVGNTSEKSVSTGTGWVSFDVVDEISLVDGEDYVIVVWSALGVGDANLYYEGSDTNKGKYQSISYTTEFPDPASFTNQNYNFSVFCNYTTTTIPSDSCTYGGSGNWEIDCSDNCAESSGTEEVSGELRFYNSGEFTLTNYNITSTGIFFYDNATSCSIVFAGESNLIQ